MDVVAPFLPFVTLVPLGILWIQLATYKKNVRKEHEREQKEYRDERKAWEDELREQRHKEELARELWKEKAESRTKALEKAVKTAATNEKVDALIDTLNRLATEFHDSNEEQRTFRKQMYESLTKIDKRLTKVEDRVCA